MARKDPLEQPSTGLANADIEAILGSRHPDPFAVLGIHQAGDKFDVVVSPEEGYGTPNDMLIQVVPREAFQGVDDIQVGMQFQAQTPQGAISVVITKVEDGLVTVDGNHPLAGQTLNFAIEVVDVREATVEEVVHGHVHGAGGHHH